VYLRRGDGLVLIPPVTLVCGAPVVRNTSCSGSPARVRRIVLDKSNMPLLFSPGIREGFGKACDREVRRRGAFGNGCNDAR
jgi:hypothetical protein